MGKTVEARVPTLKLVLRTLSQEDVHWPKDQLMDAIHWQKMLVSALLGVAYGLIPVTGWLGLLTYFITYFSTTLIFYRSLLRIDDDAYGGMSELTNDSLGIALAVFLLCWVLMYNL